MPYYSEPTPRLAAPGHTDISTAIADRWAYIGTRLKAFVKRLLSHGLPPDGQF